jgi:hypothetical protein
MSFKKNLLLTGCILFCNLLWSQNNTMPPFFSLQVKGGVTFGSVRDKTFSALPYTNESFYKGAEAGFYTRNSIHRVAFFYTGSQLNTSVQTFTSMHLRYGTANYQFLKQVTDKHQNKRLRFFAGGTINAAWNKRTYKGYINNNETKDIFLALNATAEIVINMNRHTEDFQILNQASFSIAGIVLQPVYGANAWVIPIESPGSFKELTKSAALLAMPRFFQFSNHTTVRYNITGKHALVFNYTADFFTIRNSRNTHQVNHNIGLGYQYTFRKKQKI